MTELTSEILLFGHRLRLFAISTVKSKLNSVLIGAKLGKYLIVENPKVGGVNIKLDDETMWTITFLSKGNIYSFQTSVISSSLRPFPLVFLRFPQKVEIAPLRIEKRFPVNIQAIIKYNDSENNEPIEVKALVVDISSKGCLIATSEDISIDILVFIDMQIEDEITVKDLQAEVKSSRFQADIYYLGLSFLSSDNEEFEHLILNLETSLFRI